mmetsp:Transcript_13735/g.44431  ORF Transcript_13735/g.44431 Transcript_13735/m.44431 type:complete len:281 (-) Transcript_13735:678-1520(-)
MFPYLQTLAEPVGGADHNRDPTCDPRLFERASVVPGVLHVIHNCTKDITVGLQHFDEWFRAFKNFVYFLKYYRDRVWAKCFMSPESRQLGHLFETWSADLAEWRWGSLISAIEESLRVEFALRSHWDMRKYCGDIALPDPLVAVRLEREEDRQDDRFKTDVHAFDHSVSSLYFWANDKMLLGIANSLITLQTWVEGCSCHQAKYFWNTVGTGRSFMARRARLKREFGTAFASSCPRAGFHGNDLDIDSPVLVLGFQLSLSVWAKAGTPPSSGQCVTKANC